MNENVTIKDIANLANTSKTTVSCYLSGQYKKMSAETKARIEKVIAETHYQPNIAARMLNSKSSHLIGVLIADITNEFSNQLIKGIDAAMKEDNYQMILANHNYDPKKEADLFEEMNKMGVDGFIVQPTQKFFNTRDKYASNKKPMVFIDSQIRIDSDKWVKSNNYEAVFDAMEEMIKSGYEEFLMITADPSVLSTRMERSKGFYDAMNIHKMPYNNYIVDENITSEEISEYISKNIHLDKKTLLFAPNCWLLPILYRSLQNYRSLIPNNIGIVGFDNREWADFAYPTVTTIVQPSQEEGQAAYRILIDEIENRGIEAPNQILKCKLNLNESTNLK
jgi:DNA-binding LacI/PurR family transcriptional regulator